MLIKTPPPTPPLKERMHTGYVLLSNEPKASWCAVKTTVIYHSLLCVDSFYLKAKTETASKIPCAGYPLVLVRRLRRISCAKTPAWKGDWHLCFSREVSKLQSIAQRVWKLHFSICCRICHWRASGHMCDHPESFKASFSLRAPHSFSKSKKGMLLASGKGGSCSPLRKIEQCVFIS